MTPINQWLGKGIYTSLLLVVATTAGAQCGSPSTLISSIQGDAGVSPLKGKQVQVEAIVSATYQEDNRLKGFFLIEEPSDQDNNNQTSEGIFIYSQIPVQPGQLVNLKGKVKEHYGLTELTSIQNISICKSNHPVPPATPLSLLNMTQEKLESLESMPVALPATWVSGNSNAMRFGEFQISGQDPFQNTQSNRTSLVVDDSYSGRGYNFNHIADAEVLRLGSKIAPVDGILSFGFGNFKLLARHQITLAKTDNRPAQHSIPKAQGFSLAQLNVENFFNGNGRGSGFPTSRGKKSVKSFQLQKEKLALTISQFNADAVALIEMENDGFDQYSAIYELTTAINRLLPSGKHYQITNAENGGGSDQITQAFLYRANRLNVLKSKFLNLQMSNYPARPALSISAILPGSNLALQIHIIHFKSRGRKCPGDKIPAGQDEPLEGNCSNQRIQLSQSLLTQLPKTSGMQIIAGDFNAYPGEQALIMLSNNGWTNTRDYLGINNSYSYVFKNKPITLDHFFINTEFAEHLSEQYDWHINAAESDYVFEQELKSGQPTIYRSSDHDPGILFLNSGEL